MSWLVAGDHVIASLEVADTPAARRRGLLGRDGIEGALLLTPARMVHTLGMRFPIDVAHLDADMVVLSVVTMAPWRIGKCHRRAHHVIEAEAGALRHWGVEVGIALDVRA
jgi:uncharacterized membrane protein (UPF0127 family)